MPLTVDLNQERLDNVVSDHLEVGVTDPVGHLQVSASCHVARRGAPTVVLDPVKKLSRTVTSWPSSINRSTKCDPTNPAPPVTEVSSDLADTASERTEDSLSLAVGEKLDRGEVRQGGELDGVGLGIDDGLLAVVLLGGARGVDDLGAVLDEVGRLALAGRVRAWEKANLGDGRGICPQRGGITSGQW